MPRSSPRLLALPDYLQLYRQGLAKLAKANQNLAPGLDEARRQWLWQHGFLADKSLAYDFEHYAPELFLSDLQREMTSFLNGSSQIFLRDKLVFHKTLQGRLPVAELLAVAHPWRGDHLSQNWKMLLHGPEPVPVFCKPMDTGIGRGVFRAEIGRGRVLLEDQSLDEAGFMALLHQRGKTFKSAWYLVTRGVQQHQTLQRWWPGAVNTVRLLCIREPRSDRSLPIVATLRMGTSRSGDLDNFGQGGLVWELELESGRIGRAMAWQADDSWAFTDRHPDTGQQLAGEVLPHWDKVLALGRAAMQYLELPAYVGWDIAIGPEGPVLIEGNDYPAVRIHQFFGPLLRDERVRRFFAFYGILEITGPDLDSDAA